MHAFLPCSPDGSLVKMIEESCCLSVCNKIRVIPSVSGMYVLGRGGKGKESLRRSSAAPQATHDAVSSTLEILENGGVSVTTRNKSRRIYHRTARHMTCQEIGDHSFRKLEIKSFVLRKQFISMDFPRVKVVPTKQDVVN